MNWPFWTRRLGERTVTYELDAEQASALHHDLADLLRESESYPERVVLLNSKLAFDADWLADR